MEPSWWLPLLGFALVTCGTPGPNNMLLTSAGANLGVRRSLPMLFAVVGGLNLLILAAAMGLGVLFSQWPLMHLLLKGGGSLYLLWLAWKLAWAAPPDGASASRLPNWYQAALLQLLNPKGWLMALSAIGSFTLAGQGYWASALGVQGVFFAMGILTGGVWLLFGASVGRWLGSPRAWQRFNFAMAGLTAACVLMLWW
ncbi:LysE family translocator [Pseudaeromonas sp. ZJS20]|uniref:LysE family translocator n=1 Tax=Pseudaeromonas aegiceratis TaxID=3153928 RepID=UPI00390C5191